MNVSFLNSINDVCNCSQLKNAMNRNQIGGVQQCRSTTVPKKAGSFQNNFNAFCKNVCNAKMSATAK